DDMRALIDAWWPHVEAGAEAIVMTASGCGSTVKEYGHLLRDDPAYAAKAERISSLTSDLSEVLAAELPALTALLGASPVARPKVAFHSPCSLQHGQQVRGKVESVLEAAGCELVAVPDAHLCCGSAGTYSILQPALSKKLRDNKLAALQAGAPEAVATANIGCLAHLQSGTQTPVSHWVQLLDERLGAVRNI
ncbi:MAG: glycolate oxidase iron-sulfur subunit, partial [Betaproteobacteria bacterium]|nr:glycolate oxidase iron-sulfur subunit [Betaproteobacteria bacterium]